MFVLPQGTHSLLAKIINKRTGAEEKTCSLKYKVIIRQCVPYKLGNTKLRMRCDLNNIWGSKCTFSCKHASAELSHHRPIVCADDLEWRGEEPLCYHNSEDNLNNN